MPTKKPSVFGYAWRGFRLLRRRRNWTVAGAAHRAGVPVGSVNYSETRHGNVDFLVAERLLGAYGASIVDLGLMARLAEEHLVAAGRDSLYEALVPAILAEFEQRRGRRARCSCRCRTPRDCCGRSIGESRRLSGIFGKPSAASKRCVAPCRPSPGTWAPIGTRGQRKELTPLNCPGGLPARTRRRIGEVLRFGGPSSLAADANHSVPPGPPPDQSRLRDWWSGSGRC